uniref:6-phosphogluconolactonase n=1 Tax=Globisporangium ultimum (strain ATCC 200006 / CBS 805.95 / DAOM BR144) TaxID=431595 RepID=K3WX42_GLOUD
MRISQVILFLSGAIAALTCINIASAASNCDSNIPEENVVLYVGAYTRIEPHVNGSAKGLSTFSFNPKDGSLTYLNVTDVGVNPTFVLGKTINDGKKQIIYVNNESNDNSTSSPSGTTGYVVALEVTGPGQLKVLGRRETMGANPVHVSLSPNEDVLAASVYGGGAVVLYPVNEDGSLAPASDAHYYPGPGSLVNPARQDSSHMHSTTWVPGSDVVFAPDLGTDRIVQYKFDEVNQKFDNTTFPIVKRAPGSGPRHMDIHPSGKIAYVVDEFGNHVGVYILNKDKSLPATAIQNISALPADFTGSSDSADIHVTKDGQFVYTSNRGHNSISIFKVKSQEDGTLELIGHESSRGAFPRSLLLYKGFLLVSNQNSDNIEVFRRNADGTLTHTGHSAKSSSPVGLYIAPTI